MLFSLLLFLFVPSGAVCAVTVGTDNGTNCTTRCCYTAGNISCRMTGSPSCAMRMSLSLIRKLTDISETETTTSTRRCGVLVVAT